MMYRWIETFDLKWTTHCVRERVEFRGMEFLNRKLEKDSKERLVSPMTKVVHREGNDDSLSIGWNTT